MVKINRAVGTSLAGAILWLVPLAGGVPLKVMAAVMWQQQTVSPHCRPEAAKEGRRQDVQRLRVCRQFTSSHDRLHLTATAFNLSNGCRESALIRCHLCQWNLTPHPPKKRTPRGGSAEKSAAVKRCRSHFVLKLRNPGCSSSRHIHHIPRFLPGPLNEIRQSEP